MTWLFAEVWVWSIAAFLVGALLTWLLFVRPLRRRLDDALDGLYAESDYPDSDHDDSRYYPDTSGALPVAEYPDRVGPDSLHRRDRDEDEPTFGDWDRPRGWSPPADVGVHEEPHQPMFDWDQSGRPRSVQPPSAAAAPPEPTDQFNAPGLPAGPTPPVPPAVAGSPGPAGGSGSSWFHAEEDTQALAPEGHGGGSEGQTDMFRPMNEASPPGGQASMPPPIEQRPATPAEGHTEMFRPVEDTVTPPAADSTPRQGDAAPTGQLRSLFEPLADNGTPQAAPNAADGEMTQHIPRVEADPDRAASTEMIDAAALPSSPPADQPRPADANLGSRGQAPEQPDSAQLTRETAEAAEADLSADPAGGSALPRRKPGAGPRPGAQNFNRPGTDQAAEQESYTIKGHFASRQYHTPESPQYERVIAEVWFRTRSEAEQAGFEPWDGNRSS